jgi:hypothetical protein
MKIQPGLDDQGQKVPRLPWEPKHLTYQEERKSTETLLVVASERRQAISVRSAFAPGGPGRAQGQGSAKGRASLPRSRSFGTGCKGSPWSSKGTNNSLE